MSRTNNINEDRYFGSGGGGGAVSIVFICMFIYMLLQVKSVDRSQ